MGGYVQDNGYEKPFILAPNYPAGKDALTGFKRFYKGAVAGEIYTQLGQTDYAAEIALIREADPDSVFFFLPGGMGIAFVKQYAQSGLRSEEHTSELSSLMRNSYAVSCLKQKNA